MGLYDRVKLQSEIAERLPGFDAERYGVAASEVSWQTKGLDPLMDTYRITHEGHLEHERTRTYETPREDRPFPDAEPGTIEAMAGWLSTEHLGWDRREHHGDVRFYTSFAIDDDGDPDDADSAGSGREREFVEYTARFSDGLLERITCTNGPDHMDGQVAEFEFGAVGDSEGSGREHPVDIHLIARYADDETGSVVIRDHETEVATQGDDVYHALLMLVDAIACHDEGGPSPEDLLETAERVFTPGGDPFGDEFDLLEPDDGGHGRGPDRGDD